MIETTMTAVTTTIAAMTVTTTTMTGVRIKKADGMIEMTK
jgi:hypothetical protein